MKNRYTNHKNAFAKDVFREIINTKNRFMCIFLIVALGVAFFAGIRATEPDMQLSADKFFDETNLMDVRVVSTMGLTEGDVKAIEAVEGVKEVEASRYVDALMMEGDVANVIRVMNTPQKINKAAISEGRMVENEHECVIDSKLAYHMSDITIGDKLTLLSGDDEELTESLKNTEYEVVGIVTTPLYLSFERESSNIGNGSVFGFIMVADENFKTDYYTDIYATGTESLNLTSYSEEYETYVDTLVERIENIADERCEARREEIREEATEEIDEAQEKLDKEKQDANDKLDDAALKIEDAKKDIEDAKNKIEDAKKRIEDGKKELDDGEREIKRNEDLLADGRRQLADAKEEYKKGVSEYNSKKKEFDESRKEILDKYSDVTDTKAELESQLALAEETKSGLEKDLATAEAAALMGIPVAEESLAALKSGIAQAEGAIEQLEAGIDEVEAGLAQLEDAKKQLEAGEVLIKESKKQLEEAKRTLGEKEQELEDGERELEKARKELRDGREELEKAEADVEKGEQELKDGEKTLEENEAEYKDKRAEADEKIADAEQELLDAREQVEDIDLPEWYVLDRDYVQICAEYGENSNRIGAIGKVFPVIFFLVAILVCLTTMTRMVEEERTQIGTMKALGYSKNKIAMKYLLYALLASVFGAFIGAIVGQKILPFVIVTAYRILYENLPYVLTPIHLDVSIIAGLAACACTTAAAYFSCRKEVRQSAAELMRPVAPKPGKRVLAERITFIWKRLNFTKKATVRNLFRYKKRLFMTVFGIAGCMGLLIVGFGLHDSIYAIIDNQYGVIIKYNGTVSLSKEIEEEDYSLVTDVLDGAEGVTDYMRIVQESYDGGANDIEKSAYVVVAEDPEKFGDYVKLSNRITKEQYELGKTDGVIVTEKFCKLLDISVGDEFYLKNSDNERFYVKVGAIVENYIYNFVYLTPEQYEDIFGESEEFSELAFIESNTDKAAEDLLAEKLLEIDEVKGVSFNTGVADTVHDMMSSLDFVVAVLITSAALLAFVVLINLNNININERKRELATLKVLGFFDGEVSTYIFKENVILTVLGTILGVLVGFLLHRYVIVTAEIDMTMFGREIKFVSYIYSAAFTFAFSLFVNFVMHFKLKKINMVEPLKSVE